MSNTCRVFIFPAFVQIALQDVFGHLWHQFLELRRDHPGLDGAWVGAAYPGSREAELGVHLARLRCQKFL